LPKVGENTFQTNVRNIPEVIYYQQTIKTSSVTGMQIDNQDGAYLKDAGIKYVGVRDTKSTNRVCGYRVNNFVLQETFETDFICFTELNLDPAQQDAYLAIPEVVKGDVIWDIAFTGTTDASIIFTQKQNALGDLISNWFSDSIIYIVIGIGIIGAILYFTPVGKLLKKSILRTFV